MLPCQLRLARLSLVSTTPLRRYHMKILTFSGIFDFHISLILSTGISECESARYIESTVKDPDVVRFQRNTSRPCVKLIKSKRDSRCCHDTRHTSDGEELRTCARVSFLSRTMRYKAGYCSRRVAFPIHLSSQKCISEPSFIANDPKRKRCFFTAIRPAQK